MKLHFLKKKLTKVVLILFTMLSPVMTSAGEVSGTPSDTSGKIVNPIPNINSLEGFIQKILEGVIKIGIPVVALAVVYSGFLFVKAQGNSEELGKAKDALLYTVIGAAILFGSWAIAQLISETVLAL